MFSTFEGADLPPGRVHYYNREISSLSRIVSRYEGAQRPSPSDHGFCSICTPFMTV